MSDVKRWLAVPGPGSYVRLMPVGDEASGVDIFAKSNELHALAAQLATANERLREADEIVRDLLECGCDDHREIARKWRVSYGAWLAGSAGGSQT